ncbi:MAG: alpha/beta hydrolase [bacterium]
MKRGIFLSIGVVSLIVSAGCTTPFGPKAEYGITFYCPGAGNMDFGEIGIRHGLDAAGYQGQVATVLWTSLLGPGVDQRLWNARLGALRLRESIEEYEKKYPGRPVNVIGLSAGTGVAIWALEDLKPGYNVENVVLLGSSLWHRYDVGKALTHISGKIYNYYSPKDPWLTVAMKVFGTIDGVFGEDGAGAVGLDSPHGADRIVNIRWKPEFERYGNYGNHTDGTRAPFVQAYIAPHIISEGTARVPRGEVLAIRPGRPLPGGRQD